MVLNLWVEFGVFAPLSFVFISFVSYWRYCRYCSVSRRTDTFWAGMPLWVMLVYSNFTGIFLSPGGQLCFVLVLSIYWCVREQDCDNADNDAFSTRLARLVLILSVSFGSVYVWATGYDLLANHSAITACGNAELSQERCMPRMWLNGHYWTY